MDSIKYWKKQGAGGMFGNVDAERPERRELAGRLLLIGGSDGAFFAVAGAAEKARAMGIGEVRVLLPDSLKKKVPGGDGIIFAPGGASGGFGREALGCARAAADDSDYVLLAGDMGKNAETAVFAGELLRGVERPMLVTRDAVDLVAGAGGEWLEKESRVLLLSLTQLQRVMRAVYYPRMVTLTMPLNQLVEVLHKLTITYPVLIVTYYGGQVVVAKGGEVVTTEIGDTGYTPIDIWSGGLAVRMAGLLMWNRGREFEAVVRAVVK